MAQSLQIKNLGKKFGNNWIFKSLDLLISPYDKIAILGANGSGKSTLLKIMAGFIYFDKGSVNWTNTLDSAISEIPNFSFSSPYLDIFEYLTIAEHINFHLKQNQSFKNINANEIIEIGNFGDQKNKMIRQLSSGTKQRFKNILAILTQSEVLFLDEPCSNLDEENTNYYQELVKNYTKERMVIIASNHLPEYDFISTKEYKIENGELHLLKNKQLWV